MEDLLDNTFNKSVSLLVVEVLISNFSESSEGMSLVDRVGSSLSLRSDGSSHSVYKFYIFLRLIFYLFMEVDLIDELSDLWVVQVETLNVVEKGLFDKFSGFVFEFVSDGKFMVLFLVLISGSLSFHLFYFFFEFEDLVFYLFVLMIFSS